MLVYRYIDAARHDAARMDFERLAERTADLVQDALMRPRYGLGGARGAFAAEQATLDVDRFARYVRASDLAREFPGVRGFGLIERVPREDLPAWQAAVAAQYGGGFQVNTRGEADDLFVIRSIEPLAENRAALGLDTGSEPHRRRAAETAWHDGRLSVTAPITILQDPRQRPGALMMMPVFASGLAQRRDSNDPTLAIVYAAFSYADPIERVLGEDPPQVALRLLDLGPDTAPQELFHSDAATPAESVFSYVRDFDLGGRQLRVELRSTPLFDSHHAHQGLWLWGVGGSMATLLAALLAHSGQRTRQRAERLAAEMTRELDRLAMVARLTINAVVVTDPLGRVEWVNPAFERLSGFPLSELKGHAPDALLCSERSAADHRAEFLQALRSGASYQGECWLRARDGHDYLVAVETRPIRSDAGLLLGSITLQTDITEQRRQAEALRLSEDLLNRMGEVAEVGGWQLDLRSGQLDWTTETRRIHEVDEHFVPTLESAMAFYPPEARDRLDAAVAHGIQTGDSWDLELPFITGRGRAITVRAVGEVEFEEGQAVRLIGAFQDVSERVRQRETLSAERERLQNIIDGTAAGTWEWNVQTGETRFNERWAQIVGYRLDELSPTDIQTWMRFAHPEDLERSGQLLQAHFAGESDRYECEARMRHRDGRWVWVLDRGRVRTWTADGKPEWMFGTHQDISDRKAAEFALAEKSRLLQVTLESIGDAVITTDAAGCVQWLNPVAEAMTGWHSEDALGKASTEILQLRIEDRDEPAPCPIEACLREGRPVGLAGDTRLLHRDGVQSFVIEDSASPVRDETGAVLGAVIVFHDVTEKARLAVEMSHRASHDALTGLINRAEFERRLQRALLEASETQTGAVLFIDLDHFKVVNDTSGHAAGDLLLRHIAGMLGDAVRVRDVVARFGGDEFAILLEGCPLDRALAIAEGICASLDHFRFSATDGRRYRVGASIGLVPLDQRWASMSTLLQAADAACYTAKAEGRGRVVIAHAPPSLTDDSAPLSWGPLIEEAIVQDRFELFAQRVAPAAPASVDEGLHCELLLRLKDENGNWVSPGSFMPAAERYQLAGRIDRWVLRTALDTLREHGATGLKRVAINVSGQSIGDRLFHEYAIERILDSGLPPSILCIEITETTAIIRPHEAAEFVRRLRAMGVQIALDDFGAGASSYGYLKHLDVDVLKIDGQFVQGLLRSELDRVAVRSFIEVAKVLSLEVVAEQLESTELIAVLRGMGVHYVQGFAIHRPEPLHALLGLTSPLDAEAS